jgi:hypothetical protein
MTEEKKPGTDSGRPSETVHTAQTLKVDASEVQKLVARSALAGHDFGAANASGFVRCSRCGLSADAQKLDLVKQDCPPR